MERAVHIDLARSSDAELRQVIEGAMAGDGPARHALVVALAPAVQSRVARALLRRAGAARGRRPRQDLEDMVQEVFAALFARDGRALLAWDPGRGLSLERFVGFLAEREVAMILRTGKRSPWTEDPTLGDAMELLVGSQDSDQARVESRELLARLCDRLREQLSPRGRHYFQLLFVEGKPMEVVAAETGLTMAALYAWRSRLGKLLRTLRGELVDG